MRQTVLFAAVLLVAVLAACGPAPAPTTIPAGPPALSVTGKVGRPLAWTLDELKALGMENLTLEHPKKGPTEYAGVRLSKVLDRIDLAADAATLVFVASDGFSAEVAVADARACTDCLVTIDGTTLSLAMPGMSSKAWVKAVIGLEVK